MPAAGSMLSADSPPQFSDPLPGEVDVVVIGGGIIGVSVAWFLRARGQRVAIVEKGLIGAEQSRRNWGWIRKHGRDRAELPIVIESIEHWRAMAAATDVDIGFKQSGVLYLARDEAELESRARWLDIARDFDLDSRLLSRAELGGLLHTRQPPWIGAAYTASDARAEPFVAVPAIARVLHGGGVSIIEHCAARSLELAGGEVCGVATERGIIRCAAVVCAGGAWTSLFMRHLGHDFPQLTVRATVARTAAAPALFDGNAASAELAFRRRADGGYTLAAAGRLEHFIGADSFRYAMQFLPGLRRSRKDISLSVRDGVFGRLKPIARWDADSTSPFEETRVLNPSPSAPAVAEIERQVRAQLPELGAIPIVEAWAGMIDAMPDVVPVMDAIDAVPGCFVAAGFSGHGFGIGPGAGRVMADMVLGRPLGHDVRRFRFDRFRDGSPVELGPAL